MLIYAKRKCLLRHPPVRVNLRIKCSNFGPECASLVTNLKTIHRAISGIMGADPQYAKYPDLTLAQDIFTLSNSSATQALKQSSLKKLQDAISEQKMAPLYRHLAHPIEGILNGSGEGSIRNSSSSTSRNVNGASSMKARRRSSGSFDFPWDEALYEKLKTENDEELESFKVEEEEAEEKAGDSEVSAARGKRAEFFARIGDKVNR